MSLFPKILVLAVLQGLTEFLPVSSSAHLVLGKHFLKLDSPGPWLEIALHGGTLLAVLAFYRARILELVRQVFAGEKAAWTYAMCLVAGSVPAAAVYAMFGDRINRVFDNPFMTSVMLCMTGLFLLSLKLAPQGRAELGWGKGLGIGIAQAVALLPGISRSGSTITTARFLGLPAEKAVEFSLLLSLPAVGGAVLMEMVHCLRQGAGADGSVPGVMVAVGVTVSACVGYLAIAWLVRLLSTGKLWLFGFYCLAAGLFALMVL